MIIYLNGKSRQIAQWLPKFQHLVGGVPLLLSGFAKFGDEAERPMAIVEIAVALVVVGAFVKELHAELRSHGHAHPKFGWFDLAAGGLLIFEAFHGARTKPGYMRPQFLSGVVTIAMGLLHARIHARKARSRYLKLDENGFEFRTSRFRRLALRWEELHSIELSGPTAVFHRKDGRRHKVRIGLLHNAAEVRQGLAGHASAAGVPTDLQPGAATGPAMP